MTITPDDIRRAKKEGLSDNAIAERFGVSYSLVRGLRHKHKIGGLSKSQAGSKAVVARAKKEDNNSLLARFGTPEKVQREIERLRESGHNTNAALAAALGVNASNIRYWMQKLYPPRRPPRPAPVTVPVAFVCDDCDIRTETELPAPVAAAALNAWERVHRPDSICLTGGDDLLAEYRRKWGQ